MGLARAVERRKENRLSRRTVWPALSISHGLLNDIYNQFPDQFLIEMKAITSILLLLLLVNCCCLWSNQGNLSAQNITDIVSLWKQAWNQLSSTVQAQQNCLAPLATAFSNLLNAKWDRFWNVAISSPYTLNDDSVTPYDSLLIVYGYAFRGHWGWWNQDQLFPVPFQGNQATDGCGSGAPVLDLVLWKDYNCYNPINGGSVQPDQDQNTIVGGYEAGLSTDDVNGIFQSNYQLYPSDPWSLLFYSVNQLNTKYGNAWSAVFIKNSWNTGFSFCDYKDTTDHYFWSNWEFDENVDYASAQGAWTFIVFRTRYEAQGGS